MSKSYFKEHLNNLVLNQLRKRFNEENETTKNVTYSLSIEVIDSIEDIIEKNKLLAEKYQVSGLPITRSDVISNAITSYIESYELALATVLKDLDCEIERGKVIEVIEPNIHADTIVVAAHPDGFNKVFLKDHEWYKVRMANWRKEYVKYVAIYVGSPFSQVTHYAEIKKIENIENGKYKKFILEEPVKLDNPISLGPMDSIGLRQSVYTRLDHMLTSKHLSDLSEWWHKKQTE
ncbi:hypothetical protein P9305_15175 [Lysinibacillus capsici]|uniref:hypothetical protein n=1 Tax=Lysinibacillus capsici TaxID=2115968 RepID=UPI002E1D76D7|nr:hypothetical protein [Lysinibacillus capsici]